MLEHKGRNNDVNIAYIMMRFCFKFIRIVHILLGKPQHTLTDIGTITCNQIPL